MEEIYTILKSDYGLKSSHIQILQEFSRKNQLSAKELVFRTKIPIGSIYEFVRDLVDFELIHVISGKNPTIYTVINLSENVLKFVDKKFENHLRNRENIFRIIESSYIKKEYLAFDNYEEFKIGCLKISPNTYFLYGEIKDQRLPIIFFPKEKEKYKLYLKVLYGYDFNTISSILTDNYWSTLDDIDDIKWIISEKDLTRYINIIKEKFGKVEYNIRKKEIKEILNSKNIQIKVCDDSISYHYYITQSSVQLILMKEPFVGTIIPDLNVISKYRLIFENKFNKLKDVLKYLS